MPATHPQAPTAVTDALVRPAAPLTPKTLQPLGDRLLVKPDVGATHTPSGKLEIPQNARTEPCRGTVVAAGDGLLLDSGERRPLSVQAGARVVYEKYRGDRLEVAEGTGGGEGGDELLVLREADVLAVIEGGE